MKQPELEKALRRAYELGYMDKGVNDYDFHQHEHPLLDNGCNECKWHEFNKRIKQHKCVELGIVVKKNFFCKLFETK